MRPGCSPRGIDLRSLAAPEIEERVRKKIGECLIQAGLISEDDLQVALAEHKKTGERVGAVLVRLNLATEKQITKALAYQLRFPSLSLPTQPPHPPPLFPISTALP